MCGCVGGKSHRPDLDLYSSGESVAFGWARGTVCLHALSPCMYIATGV